LRDDFTEDWHVRIAVMAAGAVGGYFGGRMAAAGHDVTFIARGAHGDAIRRNGLKIESALGDLYLKGVKVTDDPKQVGTVHVVLFAVKLWDTEAAGQQTRALVGSNTRVITLQNGVDSVERLAPILGGDATIGGATYIVAKIARPGVIIHTGVNAKVLCGRLGRPPAPAPWSWGEGTGGGYRRRKDGRSEENRRSGPNASRHKVTKVAWRNPIPWWT
jgi:2-dehydropantoate 2-reductase